MIHLNCNYNGKRYYFSSITGWLLSRSIRKATPIKPNISNFKAKQSLEIVNNPFLALVKPTSFKEAITLSKTIKIYIAILIWLYKYCPMGLFLLSKLRLNIFKDGYTAAEVFKYCNPHKQHVLCLPRSIFIATTSKRFKKSGAMFIGVFLPSKHMHSWVIEDGVNPCEWDAGWTNFTPVAIII